MTELHWLCFCSKAICVGTILIINSEKKMQKIFSPQTDTVYNLKMRRQIGPSVKVTNGCLGFVYWSGGICVEAILVTNPEREKHQNSLFSGHVLVVHSRNRREPLYGFGKPVWEEKWARSIALIVRSPYFSDDHHGRQDMPGNTKVYMRREMHRGPGGQVHCT